MPILKPATEESWQFRAVKESGGNQSMIGCVVLALLGWQNGRKPPRFGRVASINKEGYVITNFQKENGMMCRQIAIGKIDDMVGGMRKLSDHLKLTDSDREELFSEFRKWIWKDDRAEPAPLK